MTPTEEIKERLDIIEFISGYLKLQRAGKNFKGLCPFHNEKDGSFMVSPDRQMWHCFGCGEGGDIFDFLMKIEGLEFVDALRVLAQRTGVVLKSQDKQEVSKKAELFDICELSTKFFQKHLTDSKTGQKAYQYLKDRGLTDKTIKDWRLGWAPDGWDGLHSFLESRKFSQVKIVAAGLAIKSEKRQGVYDRFRSRIMFPLFDIHGQVVGFAGRIFNKEDDKQGKYINTPQTEIYDKSRVLYGIHTAKTQIRKKQSVVLVEGNLDVILSQQAGFTETVAASGTALAQQQLKILKRYTDNLTFAFDDDEAGILATKKAASLALANEFSVKIVSLPKGKDPADVVLRGKEIWQRKIEKASDFLDFLLKKLDYKYDLETTVGKKRASAEILPIIKKISNPVERAHWLSRLSGTLAIGERYLAEALDMVIEGPNNYQEENKKEEQKQEPKTREQKIQEIITSFFLAGNQQDDFEEEINKLLPEDLKDILIIFKENNFDQKKLLEKIKKDEQKKYCQKLMFLSEQEDYKEEDVKACFCELKKIDLKKKISEVGQQIKKNENSKQKEKLRKNLNILQNLLEELNDLEN